MPAASEQGQSWSLKAAVEKRFSLARPGHCFLKRSSEIFFSPFLSKPEKKKKKKKKLTGRFPDDEMVTSFREAAMAAAKSASSSSEVTRG